MKTKTITLYTFDELDNSAKETARDWFKQDIEFHWSDDWQASLKGFAEIYPVRIDDWSIGPFCPSHCTVRCTADDDAESLRGVRLWKWLNNNGYFAEKILGGDCPFTGYCADEDILDPIRAFKANPTDIDLADLMQECADSWVTAYQKDWEYQYEDESVDDNITCNEYEFTGDGARA